MNEFGNFFDLINEKLITWLQELVVLMPNLLLASLVTVVGVYFSKWLKRAVKKLLLKFDHASTITNLLLSFIYIVGVSITIFTALSILKLDKAVTSLLAGAGIVGLALAFAFQDIAANFISGIFLSIRKPIQIDDFIRIEGFLGRVKKISLRDTILQTVQGEMVIIPNKMVFQSPIENFTLLGKRRYDLEVGVSYGENLEQVKELTLEAVKNLDNLCPDDETTFFYKEFASSSINFVVRMWVNSPEQATYNQVGSDAIISIKKAFDQNNIVIPFPIRTIDFGIKGGTPLSEMPIKYENVNGS